LSRFEDRGLMKECTMHYFCYECLIKHFETSKRNHCPMCKKEINYLIKVHVLDSCKNVQWDSVNVINVKSLRDSVEQEECWEPEDFIGGTDLINENQNNGIIRFNIVNSNN